jgi:hypothetical protein
VRSSSRIVVVVARVVVVRFVSMFRFDSTRSSPSARACSTPSNSADYFYLAIRRVGDRGAGARARVARSRARRAVEAASSFYIAKVSYLRSLSFAMSHEPSRES